MWVWTGSRWQLAVQGSESYSKGFSMSQITCQHREEVMGLCIGALNAFHSDLNLWYIPNWNVLVKEKLTSNNKCSCSIYHFINLQCLTAEAIEEISPNSCLWPGHREIGLTNGHPMRVAGWYYFHPCNCLSLYLLISHQAKAQMMDQGVVKLIFSCFRR